jgi:transcriptional regulator with XRE-family HTH domain
MRHDDTTTLAVLGDRITRRRLELGLTQAELAKEAGIAKRTIESVEAGGSTHLVNFIRVLRVLGLLDALLMAIPDPGISPMQMVRLRGKEPKRASRRTQNVTEARPWKWGDEK